VVDNRCNASRPFFLCVMTCAVACGGTRSAQLADLAPSMDGPGVIGQHGIVVDYFSGMPLAGFTVTDGAQSTTTDTSGSWTLPAPMGVTLAPVVTGPSYTQLFLPDATAASADVDRGSIPAGSAQNFALEQSIIGADSTKALVQIIIVKTGACTSIAGGTVSVNLPAGASVAYFSAAGFPSAASLCDVPGQRPAAVVYNVPPGSDLQISINHPSCKQVATGAPLDGATYSGRVKTLASEPGDYTSSLVFAVQ
jgi:hypothetical protein